MFTQLDISQIVVGMEVYDNHGARVGTVGAYRYGEGSTKTNQTNIVTIVDSVSETLGPHKDLSTVFYMYLYDKGFLCVRRGLLRRDVVVFLDQIVDIGEETIFLNVGQKVLVKV